MVRGGGSGVKIQKNHWGIIFGPKMMILQGVRRQTPYTRVCYANNPKKGGGYKALALALDLTTSLRRDSWAFGGLLGAVRGHIVELEGPRGPFGTGKSSSLSWWNQSWF